MNREKLYEKTVSILSTAFKNDTLHSQECTACAVGNLVASNNDYRMVEIAGKSMWMDKHGNYFNPKWIKVFGTPETTFCGIKIGSKKQFLNIDKYKDDAKLEIKSTGYNLHELATIENAFERGYRGKDKMFNALICVIECLDKIHGNTDIVATEKSISEFCYTAK